MDTDIYRFKVGTFECMAVSDGTLTYGPPIFPPPATFLFASAPTERLEVVLGKYGLSPVQWAEWVSPYICLVVNTGTHRVLVDTGADGIGPNTGKLLSSLEAGGISPDDIDTVILTHGHPDHIGGNTGGDGKLVFPGARYVMWKDEWDFWTSRQAELMLDEHSRDVLLGAAHKNLPPIQDKLDLIDCEVQVVPGISAVAAAGHTPGHMALAITSGSEQLLCISDAFLHPIHVEEPEWLAVVDLVPEQVVATRRRLLDRAVAEKALVLAFHFPFPGLGNIVQEAGKWRWQPIETIA